MMPKYNFPNDNKRISWGVVTPIVVEPGKFCPCVWFGIGSKALLDSPGKLDFL
jgi:hypothetical protein